MMMPSNEDDLKIKTILNMKTTSIKTTSNEDDLKYKDNLKIKTISKMKMTLKMK